MEFITAHWVAILAITTAAWVLFKEIAKVTPTTKDDAVVAALEPYVEKVEAFKPTAPSNTEAK